MIPILRTVETPDFFEIEVAAGSTGSGTPDPAGYPRPASGGLWAAGERITWVAGLVLALSSFMGWYAGSGVGVKLAVIGWHTGVLGKLVFFIGLAVLALVALRESGFELPPAVPESLVVLALGALAAIFVLIRIISIPDAVLPADGRGIGIWIALLAAIGVIFGGLVRAAEEL
jgi:asparagine N-glycosylation enzyme membrane subunit Stt3